MVRALKDPEWAKAADAAIRLIAEKNSIVVGDMVIAEIEKRGLKLDNYSQLGGVFKRAAKARIITKITPSNADRSNTSKTVWKSLVYKGEL